MTNNLLIAHSNPKSPTAEAFRTLRTNIQFSNIDKKIKTIVVTSSGPGEGKSTVISNLAVTMAQVYNKVIIIDADLRKPRVHRIFSVFNSDGLTTVLADRIDYKEAVKSAGIKGLDVLTSGPIPPNPAELLGSKRMKNFIEELSEEYDMILIDAPPIGIVTDAAVLSTICDGVILVCAVGQAVINAAVNAKNLLEKVNANILGVIMNKIPIDEGVYYKHHFYSYYQSYYEDEDIDIKRNSRVNSKRKAGARSRSK
ncbi:MAG: CpsD/CapB family tyrosine-protein kinase [Tissierellales bacterium]